jgi:hypothetical protein
MAVDQRSFGVTCETVVGQKVGPRPIQRFARINLHPYNWIARESIGMNIKTIRNTQRRLFDILAAVEYLHELGADSVTVNFVRNLINRGKVPLLRMGSP